MPPRKTILRDVPEHFADWSIQRCDRQIPARLKGDRRDYQKFIILSFARSGSGFLTSSLRSHGEIVCYYELFNPGPTIHFNTEGFDNGSKAFLALRKAQPLAFLDHVVFRGYPAGTSAVGFKIFYDHFEWEGLAERLSRMEGLKVIHLKRKNCLDAFLSLKLAQASRTYAIRSPDQRTALSIPLDPAECRAFFEARSRGEETFTRTFEGRETLEVTYEDLTGRYREETERMQRFLGVEVRDLSTEFVKQNTRDPAECITNFEVLKAAFAGTPWIPFFRNRTAPAPVTDRMPLEDRASE